MEDWSTPVVPRGVRYAFLSDLMWCIPVGFAAALVCIVTDWNPLVSGPVALFSCGVILRYRSDDWQEFCVGNTALKASFWAYLSLISSAGWRILDIGSSCSSMYDVVSQISCKNNAWTATLLYVCFMLVTVGCAVAYLVTLAYQMRVLSDRSDAPIKYWPVALEALEQVGFAGPVRSYNFAREFILSARARWV